jgi:hypothetical protein
LVCLPVVLAFPCILIGLLGSFAPVRGGTYFLCRRKESKGRSAKVLALT